MATHFPKLSEGSFLTLDATGNNPISSDGTSYSYGWQTKIMRFLNDSEQSWTSMPPMMSGNLQCGRLSGYDLGLLREFFYQHVGDYLDVDLANVFEITVDGITYTNVVFDQPDFTVKVDQTENFTVSLKVRQVAPDYLGGGPPGFGPMTAVLNVTMDYQHNSAADPGLGVYYGAMASTDGIGLLIPVPNFFYTGPASSSLTTHSMAVDPYSVYNETLFVLLGIETEAHTTPVLSPPATYNIYEVWVDVTYPDGKTQKFRPSSYAVATGYGAGAASNLSNMGDGDPSTFATILLIQADYFLSGYFAAASGFLPSV